MLDLVMYPNPIFKEKAEEIKEFNEETRKLANEVLETMYKNDGCGLTASHCGIAKRIVTLDTDATTDENGNLTNKNPLIMINPVITEYSDDTIFSQEGSLSLPKISARVVRSKNIKVKYQDLDGKEQILDCDGLKAACVQHEIDQTNGVFFLEKLTRKERKNLKL